jgi:hypothetical protein
MLKIDTQGYEMEVLKGAEEILHMVKVLQIKMSLVPLYENSITYLSIIDYLKKLDFQLFALENGFTNQTTGQLLQTDGIF